MKKVNRANVKSAATPHLSDDVIAVALVVSVAIASERAVP